FRFVQAAVRIFTGKTDRLIAGHEAEEELEQLKHDSANIAEKGD
ncbi:TRAP transporter small permease, partial [Vibrio sp. 10N.222.49.C9]